MRTNSPDGRSGIANWPLRSLSIYLSIVPLADFSFIEAAGTGAPEWSSNAIPRTISAEATLAYATIRRTALIIGFADSLLHHKRESLVL
jgi:hypothetical protein